MNQCIKFGPSLIDISKVQSISFSVHPQHTILGDDPNNCYYYIMGVFFKGESTPRTYCGCRNDVYETLFKLEELEIIDRDVIGDFEEYVKKLDDIAKDYDDFNTKNLGLNQ